MKLLALATLGILATAVPVMAATGVMGDLGGSLGLQTDHGSADAGLDGALDVSHDDGVSVDAATDDVLSLDTSDLPVDGATHGASASASQDGASADVSVDDTSVGT